MNEDKAKMERTICNTIERIGKVPQELPITAFVEVSSILRDLYNQAFNSGFHAGVGSNILNKNRKGNEENN